MSPEQASVYGYNELIMNAPREHIWAWLINAVTWPEWYNNSKDVRVHSGNGRELGPNSTFTWTTFGTRLSNTKVQEFVPLERLSWRAQGLLRAYHGWVLEPIAGGVRVVSEETQRGAVPALMKWYIRPRLRLQHQRWLEGLAQKAGAGPPRR
jgi:hypothetical protein